MLATGSVSEDAPFGINIKQVIVLESAPTVFETHQRSRLEHV